MLRCAGATQREKRPRPRHHASRFIAFWATATGLSRIAFFILTYACLFFAARVALDEKWVGMASALPLPGFFALATPDRRRRGAAPRRCRAAPIRDTLFLGPLLVIPFNWIFSHALLTLQLGRARYLLLLAMWAVAALLVLWLVPLLAAHRDRA